MRIDTKLTRIRVSTTATGTFANVGFARSFELNRGRESTSTTYYFGGEAKKVGDKTLGGSISVLFDRDDTTGQEVLRAAYDAGTTVFLQFAPAGTASGAKVDQFEALITEAPVTSDRSGDWVEGSFSYDGYPDTLSTITLI